MRFYGLSFLVFLFAIVATATAQNPVVREDMSAIQGVIASEAGEPVSNAHVYLAGGNENDVSDINGLFKIAPLAAGKYTLLVEHVSYEKQKVVAVTVPPGAIAVVDTIYLKPTVRETESVVVTARREGRGEMEIASALNMVSRIDLERRQAKTSAEALREESGVFVQKTNHGGGSAIIRGLSSNQILLLVDGIRLNNSTYRLGNHQYLTTVDYNTLSRIEVLRGPGAVLHGSDALGGTINLITQKPDFETQQWQWNGSFTSRYASADEEKAGNIRLSGGNREWAFSTTYSYKDFGDLRQGSNAGYQRLLRGRNSNVQQPTAFKAWDASAKLLWEADGSGRQWVLAWQHSDQQDVPRYDKYAYDNNDLWTYDPQKRDLLYLKLRQKTALALAHTLEATVSRQVQEEGRNTRNTAGDPLQEERDETETLGFSMQAGGAWGKHLLSYGIDLYRDDVSSLARSITAEGVEPEMRGRYPDGARYTSLGIFLEDEYHPAARWIVTGGLRYSRFNTTFDIVEDPAIGQVEQTFQSLTASGSLIYKLSDGWNLIAAVSQGFRAPNLSDLTKLGESKGNVYEVPNFDLEPEKALNFEAGVKAETDDYRVELSAWYMTISDLIGSADDSYRGSGQIDINGETFQIKSKQNIGEAFISGVEAALRKKLANYWHVSGNVAYAYGQNSTLDEPIGGIPPLFGRLGINWQKRNWDAELYSRFASSQTRLSADDKDDPRIPVEGTPGWYTINLRAAKDFGKRVTVRAAVENILDTLYREHGSGINGPGRNFIVGLKLSF